MFGGVAEQVVRRTAADLVEESSPNQILLPAALRAIVGRSYVFQVVISEQTFRTGQLCFQARRLFNPSNVQESVATNVTSGNKEASGGASDPITDSAIPEDVSTPALDVRTSTPPKNSSAKGKEAAGAVHEDHGYAFNFSLMLALSCLCMFYLLQDLTKYIHLGINRWIECYLLEHSNLIFPMQERARK
jgi:hypothetical protein